MEYYAKMPEVSVWCSPLGLLATLPEKFRQYGGFILGNAVQGFKLDKPRFNEYLYTIRKAGATGLRVLPYCQWYVGGIKQMFEPYVLVKKGTGYTFNLNKWSENYWDIVHEIIEMCDWYNLDFAYGPFDSCGLMPGQRWQVLNPWFNNLQGIKHFLQGQKAENFAMEAMDKTFKELGGYKNFFFYWCNEFMYPDRQFAVKFSDKIAAKLKGYGIPPERTTVAAQLVVPYTVESYSRMIYLKKEMNKYAKDSDEYKQMMKEVTEIHSITLQDMVKGYSFEKAYGEQVAYTVFRPIHGCMVQKGTFRFGIEADIAIRSPQLSHEFSDDGAYVEGGDDLGIDGRARPTEVMWYDFSYSVLQNRNFKEKGRTILELCPKDFAPGFKIAEKKLIAVSDAMFAVMGKRTGNYGRDKKLVV